MATFRYTALSDGAPSNGTIEANDRSDALRLLAARGEIVTELARTEGESKSKKKAKARSGPSLNKAELAAFVRDLATAIDAGLPLMQALSVMRKQASDKRQAAILAHLVEKVEAGESLWAAAQSWGAPFDDMVVGMMRAADASGRMNEVLMQLADLLDRSVELRREVAGATIYPSMVFALLVASVAVFVTFVVPGLIDPLVGMDGFEIPGPTKLLLAIADFVSNWWLVLTIGTIAAVFGFRTWASVPANRLVMDRLLLQVQLLGKLQRDVAAARFARTLGTLAASGLPILDALKITRGTMGNAALSQAIEATETEVTAGRPIAAPLESSGFFPALLIQVIGLGERTGRLDGMLLHAADAFDRQVGITIKVVTKALPPILLVFMSAIGGFVLAAVLLPMLSLGQSIQ